MADLTPEDVLRQIQADSDAQIAKMQAQAQANQKLVTDADTKRQQANEEMKKALALAPGRP